MARIKYPRPNEQLSAQLETTVLEWVTRNSGHSIPNKRIAKMYGVSPAHVQGARRKLVFDGKILSNGGKTYRLAEPMVQPLGVSSKIPKPTTIGEAIDEHFAGEVSRKAQAYYWATGNDSLKAFVKSLGDKND